MSYKFVLQIRTIYVHIYDFALSFSQKCKVPETAPERIEKVINQCQEEIKIAILTGKVDNDTFNYIEKKYNSIINNSHHYTFL